MLQKGESNNVQKVRDFNFFALCDYEHEIVRFLFKEVNKSWKTGLNIHCLKSTKTKLPPFLQYTMFGTNLTSWRWILGAIITLFCFWIIRLSRSLWFSTNVWIVVFNTCVLLAVSANVFIGYKMILMLIDIMFCVLFCFDVAFSILFVWNASQQRLNAR